MSQMGKSYSFCNITKTFKKERNI